MADPLAPASCAAFVLAFVVACGSSGGDAGDAPTDAPPSGDAGADAPPDAAGPRTEVVVTARAAAASGDVGAPASAAWAAFDDGSGAFAALTPSAAGTYRFGVVGPTWSIALVCAAPDDAQSVVAIHRRTIATTALDVTLDELCAPDDTTAVYTLTGTLSNVPAATSWLDFGYAREGRGATLPVAGTSATYEIVNVASGTWDLAFGVRDESSGPLTRVAILRGQSIAADRTIDVDMNGASAFAPGTRPFVVRGVSACDTLEPRVRHTMGGRSGIDVGPQDVPTGGADAAMTYATVPDALARGGDRYRGAIGCASARGDALRTVDVSFHAPLDLDVALPALLDPPRASIVATTPYVVVEAHATPLAGAARHELRARVRQGQRREQRWIASVDEHGEIVVTTPDLSRVPGWKQAWALPAGQDVEVTATAVLPPSALGDGVRGGTSARTSWVTP